MSWLRALWEKIWCNHQWRYVDTVKDQDLRSGYKFWSERYVCRRCSRMQTRELIDRPR